MKIKDLSLKDLRKRYADKKSEFAIKIRKNSKKPDIVYYNGIKAFYVEKNEQDEYTIEITDDIYKLNKSNIVRARDSEENINAQDKIDKLIEDISTVRSNVSKYFESNLDKIEISMGTAYYRDTYNRDATLKTSYEDVQKKVEGILNEIKDELKNVISLDVEKIVDDIDKEYEEKLNAFINKYPSLNKNSIQGSNIYEKIEYLMNKLNKDKKEKLINGLNSVKVSVFTMNKEKRKFTLLECLEIEKIFILNTIFDDEFKYNQYTGFKIPNIKYKFKHKEIDENQLDNFDTTIKNTIELYEKKSGEELEKKYQHMFMINDSVLEKFTKEFFSGIEPFEEEYYTKEKNENKDDINKRGRIDCVFIRPDTKVSDIFLIELKVNDSVIGTLSENKSVHGIVDHLKDIDELCNKSNYLKEFLKNLDIRYNDRRELLYGIKEKINLKKDYRLHFWTIIAITETKNTSLIENAKKVYEKINNLRSNSDKIATDIFNPDKKTSFLDMKNNKKCEIRLLFDIWNRTEKNNNISSEKFLTLEQFNEFIKKN